MLANEWVRGHGDWWRQDGPRFDHLAYSKTIKVLLFVDKLGHEFDSKFQNYYKTIKLISSWASPIAFNSYLGEDLTFT